jgi:hypothetical protein
MAYVAQLLQRKILFTRMSYNKSAAVYRIVTIFRQTDTEFSGAQ